jgi:adenine-specific DNA-methyltransferase
MGTAGISYMGTKRELAVDVAGVIAEAKQGLLLDAFGGMGAVAHAVGMTRHIWMNDAQRFAQLVGRCIFTAREKPKTRSDMGRLTRASYKSNLDKIRRGNGELLAASDTATHAVSYSEMAIALEGMRAIPTKASDFSCFLQTYGGGFFSPLQAAQIDSIRFALDDGRRNKRLSNDQWRWGVLSLGRACLKVANTPGHFAQFLRPSHSNFKRVQRQWQRSVWEEWLNGFDVLMPLGTSRWRSGNFATNEDSLSLLAKSDGPDIGVVYCDPPYTADHYSRYYHVWETLIEYDYPVITGAGQYRSDRFTTPFSIKSKTVSAMRDLIAKIHQKGADLVLSYPTNGLLYEAGGNPLDLLKEKFAKVELKLDIEHKHSTFGASKGNAKATVRECVYLAQN